MNSHAQEEDHELIRLNDSQSASRDLNRLKQGRLLRWFSGARLTLALASAASILVFAFNLGFLLWVVARDRLEEDRGSLYEGDCDRVRHLSTGLHLLINILGSTLLGASNYGMQCLCAPTRKDIDKAHGKGTWLDIGVPSVRNLFHIPVKRAILWICLVLSSLPLHLVYNSTIFPTTAAYAYTVFAGPDSYDIPAPEDIGIGGADADAFAWLHSCAQNKSLISLDAHDCIEAYATAYQTKHGGLILVTEDVNSTSGYEVVAFNDVYIPYEASLWGADPYAWLCPKDARDSCSAYLPGLYSDAEQDSWVVYGPNADYTVTSCLSAPLQERCKLQYSLPLTITVIVVNLIKAVILCYMSVTTSELPMLTTGDAVASFLHRPDGRTLGRCLMSGQRVRAVPDCYSLFSLRHWPFVYEARRKRWYSAVSSRRRVGVVILWAIALGICGILLALGLDQDGHGVWDAEFGAINAQALIKGDNWPASIIQNTIIANIPQLVFSTLYFILNGVVTTMALAAEWSQYAVSRQGIRVSWNPQYAQRSTYFLSLPYRYAIPLMTASAIMHWLISQSLFLVGIEAYNQALARNPDRDLATCGYTPVAIVSSMAVWIVMLACLVALSCMKFTSGMYVADSCSLAIAAACHPKYNPNLDEFDTRQDLHPPEGIEFMPLKWGALPVEGPLGHCTFSADEVEGPEAGRQYQ